MRPTLAVFALILFTISLLLIRLEIPVEKKAIAQISLPPEPRQDDRDDQQLSALHLFFSRYSCPLDQLSESFVEEARLHDLDYRLLPAISFRESTCAKHKTENNSLGFGPYRLDNKSVIPYVATAISGEGTKDGKYYMKAKKDPAAILRIYNTHPTYPAEVLDIMKEIK